MEAEEVDGRDRGHDDGKRGGEAFENIVCVFYNNSHQKAAERLVENDAPHKGSVSEQEAFLSNGGAIVPPHAEETQKSPEDPELDVPHPHRSRAALQDLLEVNAGKPGGQARDNHGHQALEVVLVGAGQSLLLFSTLLLHLDDRHTGEQQH